MIIHLFINTSNPKMVENPQLTYIESFLFNMLLRYVFRIRDIRDIWGFHPLSIAVRSRVRTCVREYAKQLGAC